ncbi:MAG: RDD family protein [Elusimicrobiota bacterium]|jgi:uncharacterized RDD family membrane protein YckC
MEKADFLTRVVAIIIDAILIAVAGAVLRIVPVLGALAAFVLPWAYYVYCWTHDSPFGVQGQTLGKKVMKIKVLMDDGSGLTLQQALMRCLGYFVTGLTLGLGCLLALGASRKALHDMVAGTQVVKA